MKTIEIHDCTLADLRNAFTGIKGKKKVFIRGLNDIVVKIMDDGNVEICDNGSAEYKQKSNVDDNETPDVANQILKNNENDSNKLQTLPHDMFIDAYNARKAKILERVDREKDSIKHSCLEYDIPIQTKELCDENKHGEIIQHCIDAAERRKRYASNTINISIGSYNFFSDLYKLLLKHQLTVESACNLLVEKKLWRKKFKSALRRRKCLKEFRCTGCKNKNPAVPNHTGICRLNIPYAEFFALRFGEDIDYPKKEKFARACERYYKENGCIIYSTIINESNIEITISRKNIDDRLMNIMDYYNEA